MKAVNVDDVLKILHKYGRYIFVTDEKRYSSMVDEIANLKALEREPCEDVISREELLKDLYSRDYTKFTHRDFVALVQYQDSVYPKAQENILDKIRAEIMDTLYVDSLIFGELIDFNNGKISADDVIEEFNRVTRLEVLKIIDKYKTERNDKE